MFFCKGKCTASLLTLVTGLQVAGIQYVTLVAYGMKMNYSECLFLDELNGPAHHRRYDIGRNISTMAIPVFGLSDAEGRVYLMFDNLGAGYGSVELPRESEQQGAFRNHQMLSTIVALSKIPLINF